MSISSNIPILSFSTHKEWHNWLDKNYSNENGIWLRFYKNKSETKSINHTEALDEALCYGWIDGQIKKYDEKSWLQKFTPRREHSIWSKRNIEHIERLIKAGRIQPSGIKEVEKAKIDGRWERAYDSPGKMNPPDDFLKKLSENKKQKNSSIHSTKRINIQSTGVYKLRKKRKRAKGE